MSNRVLPDNAQPYARTPTFTAEQTPDSLLTHHDLKKGTWGLLKVEQGEVRFFSEDNTCALAMLHAGETFVILPEERHYIEVSNDAVFYVEFYKRNGAQSAACGE